MATNDTTSTGDETLFTPEAPAADAPAPRRRASRRVTTKATTPEPSSPAEPMTDAASPAAEATPAAGPAADAAGEVAAAAEPAKRPARKRATRKKATPAPADAPESSTESSNESLPQSLPEAVTDGEDTSAEQSATAPRAARATKTARSTKRTARSRTAARAAEALEELVAEVQASDGTADETAVQTAETSSESSSESPVEGTSETTADATELEALDALEEDVDEDADEAADAGAVPSFSVLFQAPDASQATPTRRRRGAPAPAPVEAVEPDEDERDDLGLDEDLETPTTGREAGTGPSDEESTPRRSRRRRGGKGRRGRAEDDTQDDASDEGARAETGSRPTAAAEDEAEATGSGEADDHDESGPDTDDEGGSSRRRRRRRRAGSSADSADESPNVSTRVRQPRAQSDEPVGVRGSTRLEAKKQRRREGREAGRRRTIITEAEFLARREAVDRVMVVRNKDGRTQMGVLEDDVLVEHYIDQATNVSMAGNIYLGRVQNVLPSMEAAFVDIGKGRNAVLYAGEVNWDAAGLESNQPKRIENALSSGQTVLVQVTKDPIGHKGARLTSQISLPGRYLVYVPNSSMTGISRKLPDTERARLKKILRDVVPDSAGVIVRTAAEGASEEELRADVERLTRTWEDIQAKSEAVSTPRAGKSKGKKKNGASGSVTGAQAPMLLHGEPDLTVRVIRDVFNEDFKQLVVAGDQAWNEIHPYISSVAPDLADRVTKWTSEEDLFTHHRVDEQLSKAMDRKVWLPSGGSLVIDRTEAMTVVDVNTGKFVGSGGNLEETVTKNNIEAAEEIVRQLRLRDIGGIIVIDFIDMVLESNRELVVRRLLECLGRDRTKHQVAEVTSLGLVQMTRKRVGSGLIEVFSETCEHCNGRGFIIHAAPVDKGAHQQEPAHTEGNARRRGRGQTNGGNGAQGSNGGGSQQSGQQSGQQGGQQGGAASAEPKHTGPSAAQIAAAAHAAALKSASGQPAGEAAAEAVAEMQASAHHEDHVHDVHDEHHEAEDGSHPHAFPDDTGPWAGEDAPVDARDDAQGTEGGEHVELESDVVDATSEPDIAEPAVTAIVAAPVAVAPAARGRRRRGRVVAPAGPPRGATGSGDGEG